MKAPGPTLRFLLASCLYPTGLFDRTPLLDAVAPCPGDQALARMLASYLDATPPEALLIVGDIVYVDAQANLLDPSAVGNRFAQTYERLLARPLAAAALKGPPALAEGFVATLIDDHEINDNWAPISPDAQGLDAKGRLVTPAAYNQGLSALGVSTYRAYVRDWDGPPGGPAPSSFQTLLRLHDQDLFFLADTRTERTLRQAASIAHARIMSEGQWQALSDWLRSCQGQGPRFLVCPAMVLPRRRCAIGPTPAAALRSDAWDGFPASLHDLLATICELGLDNLVLLSGDEHLANISRITLRKHGEPAAKPVVIHSIHSPALYAPFPFANAKPKDFSQDAFTFLGQAGAYECQLESWFPGPANGFVTIDAPLDANTGVPLRVSLSFPAEATAPPAVPDWLGPQAAVQACVVREQAPPCQLNTSGGTLQARVIKGEQG